MQTSIKSALLGLGLAATLAGSAVPLAEAQAEPTAPVIFGVDRAGVAPSPEQVQFFYSGRNYCWYDGGWHGPGWYWCGYAWHSGWGWGGGYGWRGWRGGHPGGWYHGGGGWHGGGHGGGWHDGGDHGGGGGHGGGGHGGGGHGGHH